MQTFKNSRRFEFKNSVCIKMRRIRGSQNLRKPGEIFFDMKNQTMSHFSFTLKFCPGRRMHPQIKRGASSKEASYKWVTIREVSLSGGVTTGGQWWAINSSPKCLQQKPADVFRCRPLSLRRKRSGPSGSRSKSMILATTSRDFWLPTEAAN